MQKFVAHLGQRFILNPGKGTCQVPIEVRTHPTQDQITRLRSIINRMDGVIGEATFGDGNTDGTIITVTIETKIPTYNKLRLLLPRDATVKAIIDAINVINNDTCAEHVEPVVEESKAPTELETVGAGSSMKDRPQAYRNDKVLFRAPR